MSTDSSIKTSTIIIASAATIVTGVLGTLIAPLDILRDDEDTTFFWRMRLELKINSIRGLL